TRHGLRWLATLARMATLACLSTMLMLSVAAPAHADGEEADVIRASEQALTAAMHGRNSTRLDQLLAADYLLRSVPDVDRQTWIRNALTLCWADGSDIAGF